MRIKIDDIKLIFIIDFKKYFFWNKEENYKR